MNKNGFTLIELLVVILIIGILAAIALPKYMLVVERSRAPEALQNLNIIRKAQEVYYLQNGSYTSDWDQLDISFTLTDTGNPAVRKTKNFQYTLITGPTYNYVTAYRGIGGASKYRFELYYKDSGSNSLMFACVPEPGYDSVCTNLGGKFLSVMGHVNVYLL